MTLLRKMSVKLLARDNITLKTRSVKRLARKRIKPSINALMGRENIDVPPVTELENDVVCSRSPCKTPTGDQLCVRFRCKPRAWSASVLALIKNRNKDQVTRSSRGLGWRIHGSVEDTKFSTNKELSLNAAHRQVSHPVIPHAGEPFLLRSCGDMN